MEYEKPYCSILFNSLSDAAIPTTVCLRCVLFLKKVVLDSMCMLENIEESGCHVHLYVYLCI